MLAMSYIKNHNNPERSLWLPKKIKTNNHIFKTTRICKRSRWVICNTWIRIITCHLQFKLFQNKKRREHKKGYVKRAGSVDAYLYDTLKKYNLIQGYLQETEIEHLKTPLQTENYIK